MAGPSAIVILRPAGDDAILIETPDASTVRRLSAWIDSHPYRGDLVEVIPGARTIFLQGPPQVLAELGRQAAAAELPVLSEAVGKLVTIHVRYDGPDLESVATRCGLSVPEVIAAHTGVEYTVEFFGFSPGLAFLGGLDRRIRLPRHETPRLKVSAGSVAIANEYSIVYPQESPGGWHLIGTRISKPTWDITHSPPNLINVGDRVRFRAAA